VTTLARHWGPAACACVCHKVSYLCWHARAHAPTPPLYVGAAPARSLLAARKLEAAVSGGSTLARVKLKEIDGMAPQDVERAV